MNLRTINNKNEYNRMVTHVMQSWEWGEFRESIGTPILRYGLYEDKKLKIAFQLTLHQIPFTNQFVGYLPKGPFPDKDLAKALKQIAREHHCAFIKIEAGSELDPDIRRDDNTIPKDFIPSPKPLFTKYNFVIDLTQTEEQLLKNMHPKTRYNIKVAQKHGVTVEERTDDEALEIYLKLYFETTKRQGYHGHTPEYHRKVWEAMHKNKMGRFLIAFYQGQPLTAWMLLNFQDTLYYPYGGSSTLHRETMHSNLVAWQAIKLGKRLKLKQFDMWGALDPNADSKDPWYGFHKFKQGYGGELVEYLGTFDLVNNYPLYYAFTAIDKLQPLKLFLLKMLGK